MTTLFRLQPRKKLLTDFFVVDIETGVFDKSGRNVHWGGHTKDTGEIIQQIQATPDKFIFAVLYGHNMTKEFFSLEELKKELLLPQYKNKYVFAHNGGAFDYLVMYGGTPAALFDLDPNALFIGSKFITCSNGNCKFADSLNIFQTSLRKIGKLMKKAKGHLPKVTDFTSGHVDRAKVINYCIRDCEILYDALFQTFEFAGDIKITQASLSMTYFRRFHQEYNIEHNDNTKYFWESYFGGRTEVFKLGKTRSTVIDKNSMYPWGMKNAVFPNPKFLKLVTKVQINGFLQNILPNYEGCIFATVRHRDTRYGYLPYKSTEGKLLFPIGRFSGAWNFPEIRYALEQGAIEIESIEKLVYGPRMESPFIKFVDHLFEERFKTTHEFEQYRIKIFMNSLYGKFAQRILQESTYIKDIDLQWDQIREAQENKTFLQLQMVSADSNDAFLIVKTLEKKKAKFSIPSFASYITSFCRVDLLKKLYEYENKSVVYCDTDSIFYELEDTRPDEKFLGGWKREAKIVTEIRGLKNYKFLKTLKRTKLVKEIHLVKGIPLKAKKIGEDTWEYFNLGKSKESLRRHRVPGILTRRVKQLKGVYDKRIVLEDGNTKPITI